MSSGSKKNRKRWDYGQSPGHRGDRTVSCISEVSMTSTINSTLSPQTRETVLKLKKIPDPFSEDMQDIFDDFVTHVEECSYESVNLSETSLLLSGVTKIYSAQVNNLYKSVHELAEFVTKREKKPKEKKDTEGDKSNELQNSDSQHGIQEISLINANENREEETLVAEKASETIEIHGEGDLEKSIAENNNENPLDAPSGVGEDNVSSTDCPITDDCDTLVESNTPSNDNGGENCPSTTEGETNASEAVPEEKSKEGEVNLVDEVLYGPLTESAMKARVVLGAGPVTRKRLMCFKDLLYSKDEPCRKRDRFEIVLPPKLVPYYDEMSIDDDSCTYAGEENPPVLEMAPPPPEKRKKKLKPEVTPNPESEKKLEDTDDPKKSDSLSDEKSASKAEEATEESNIAQIVPIVPLPTIPDFAPEDQASILECINELHYLPFTFELSNNDLSMAFSKTVDRICSIFQKYNVPLSRAMIKAASAMCSGMVPKEGSPVNGGVHATLHKQLNGIHETLLKSFGVIPVENVSQDTPAVVSEETTAPAPVVIVEAAETPKKSNKTIFELTPEKTVAHSRETMRTMLEEMQRTIVPKYARIPMMEENTPEFFQRVTNFEKKMRKVLDAEATKEEFDVRKYEKEVLEVTTKETLEQEKEDEIQVPLSPIINTVLDQPSDDESTNDLDLNFQGCSSSRSSFEGSRSSSICGSRWVPLSHIFRHMKKLEKVEACRLFYAVLALLSYQNLDINYDQLYSEESARLTDKAFDHEQDGKYPRGVKIMTSRCPDVDKDEVYVTALTSKSRTEEFRDFMIQESRNLNNNNKGTEISLPNGDPNYGIQEAKEAFVEEVGDDYVGQLYGKRGRKPAKSLPIPFVPFPLRR